MKTFLPLNKPLLGPEERREVAEVLESGWLTRGPKTQAFEERFREYIGAKHAVAVNSATAGLHLALVTLGIGPGDEVITTPITYCATPNEIEHAGAKPVFADVDPETLLIDPDAVERAITPRTKALMPVHLYGQSADMDRLRAIANKYHLAIIEDAAHSIETTWRDEKIGTIGDITVFSFYATKNMTTGEGGMLTMRDARLAERAARLATHGLSKTAWDRTEEIVFQDYRLVELGFKYHMSDLAAAIGIAQLEKIGAFHERRLALRRLYDNCIAEIPGIRSIPHSMPGTHAHHLYVIEIDPEIVSISRNDLATHLLRHEIGTGVHYYGMHLQPYYAQRYHLNPEDFPAATRASERILSLPFYPAMHDADIPRVMDLVYSGAAGLQQPSKISA